MESRRKRIYKKNLKQTACVPFFLLQVTVKATTGREEKRGENRSRPPCLLNFLAAARGEDAPLLFQRCSRGFIFFFCNFQTLLCIFRLLVFDLF